MKKIISFMTLWFLVSIITFNVFSQENLISENRTYLFNYFGYESYEIIGKVQLGEVDAILAAHYVDEEKKLQTER